jgi:hypothetical protein
MMEIDTEKITIIKQDILKEESNKFKFLDIPIEIREQMKNDEVVFGNAYCLYSDGKYERIDPMRICLKDGKWVLDEKCKEIESKKTLWDMREDMDIDSRHCRFGFEEKCVKESLKDFLDWINEDESIVNKTDRTLKKAKEIFGKELFGDEE